MLVEYPDAPGLAACDDQAMLGPDLLLAPVLEAEQAQRLIRLPAGDWYDLWTDRLVGAGREATSVWVAGPSDRVPLLVRGGALLPLAPTRPFIEGEASFETLELHAYPPYPARVTLHEDDGLTRAYQAGARARTDFAVAIEANALLFKATPHLEQWRPAFAQRALTLVVHDAPQPRLKDLPEGIDLTYDPASRQLTVSFTAPVEQPIALRIPLGEP